MNYLRDRIADMLEKAHKGHLIAYTASHLTDDVWRLSIVRDGETGHYPISEDYYTGNRADAFAEAGRLNHERLKLPHRYSLSILAQSMRGSGR